MADINTYIAKNYELWGAGFGVLTYKGQVLDLISDFNDNVITFLICVKPD